MTANNNDSPRKEVGGRNNGDDGSENPPMKTVICQCSSVTYGNMKGEMDARPDASFEEIKVACQLAQHCGSCEPKVLAYYDKQRQCQRGAGEVTGHRKLKRSLLMTGLVRNFHLFSSLIAAIFLLFFSFSGYIMNHRTEYGLDDIEETTTEVSLPASLLTESGGITEKSKLLDWCRDQGAKGDLAEYIHEDGMIEIAYVCAGSRFEAEMDLETREVEILIQKNGFLETLGEIHRSPSPDDTSTSLFIDVMAVLMGVVSLSGIFLFFRMASRRSRFSVLVLLASLLTAVGYYLMKAGVIEVFFR